jgi:comEA protein
VNTKERAVLLFLVLVLAAGIVVSLVRRQRQRRDLDTVRIALVADSTAATTPDTASGDRASTHLVDINTASAAELDQLPGIGPAYAQNILDYRKRIGRFTSVEQLLNVPGIGPKRLAAIRDLVTVRP